MSDSGTAGRNGLIRITLIFANPDGGIHMRGMGDGERSDQFSLPPYGVSVSDLFLLGIFLLSIVNGYARH